MNKLHYEGGSAILKTDMERNTCTCIPSLGDEIGNHNWFHWKSIILILCMELEWKVQSTGAMFKIKQSFAKISQNFSYNPKR